MRIFDFEFRTGCNVFMSIKNLFSLSPEITHVVLGGNAYIDQEGLNIPSQEAAWDFVLNYGFDMSHPSQRSHLLKTLEDALIFLETIVLEGTGLKIPTKIYESKDPLDLLVWASVRPQDSLARWSCAILCVMHTLLYINNNFFLRFLPEIQRQILERYERFLVKKKDGQWLLKGQYEAPLLDIERKDSKNRHSLLLKLLQKPENVAETIYDYIGVRIVTEDLLDALLILRFFIDHNIFQAAHIKPSRTRNLMIDVKLLEEWVGMLPEKFSAKSLSKAKRQKICASLAQRIGHPSVNPYSSSNYSALQFTVNTLVRLPGLGVSALEKIQQVFKENGNPEIANQFNIPELIQAQEEFTFFFPHEVQIMEKTGFNNSRLGPASHLEYKRRQREAVRKRLLKGILLREEVAC